MAEIKTIQNASRALGQDQMAVIFWRYFFMCEWRDLNVPYPIEQTRLNCNNLHRSISSEPFMKD